MHGASENEMKSPSNKWSLNSLDVKTAFLQGSLIDWTVYRASKRSPNKQGMEIEECPSTDLPTQIDTDISN